MKRGFASQCGVDEFVDGLNLVRKDLLASGWEVSVEVNIVVDKAGVGCG